MIAPRGFIQRVGTEKGGRETQTRKTDSPHKTKTTSSNQVGEPSRCARKSIFSNHHHQDPPNLVTETGNRLLESPMTFHLERRQKLDPRTYENTKCTDPPLPKAMNETTRHTDI